MVTEEAEETTETDVLTVPTAVPAITVPTAVPIPRSPTAGRT